MGVAIESIYGYIYSAAYSKLFRASIDGSSRETLIEEGKIQVYNTNSFL